MKQQQERLKITHQFNKQNDITYHHHSFEKINIFISPYIIISNSKTQFQQIRKGLIHDL
jgi:hypothetical protein